MKLILMLWCIESWKCWGQIRPKNSTLYNFIHARVPKRQKVHWILDFGCLLTQQIAIKRGKIVQLLMWLLVTSLLKSKIKDLKYGPKIAFSSRSIEHCVVVCLLYYILGCCFAVCWKPSVLGETSITLHEFIKGKMYRKPLFPYPDYLEHAKISQLI